MNKQQLKNWFGVVVTAVVLGLAVTYMVKTWKPQDATHWALWVVCALIAVRSVLRIASLSKAINAKEKNNE